MLSCIPHARASFPETIQPLVRIAVEHSPALKKAEAGMKEGDWKNLEGISNFLPTLSFGANHIFEKRYQYLDIAFNGNPVEFPQIFPSSSGSLSLRWNLFDGLQNYHLFRSAARTRDAAEAQYHWARFQLERDVALAYYRFVAARRLEEAAKENLKTLQNHLDQVNHLKTGGLATSYDVLRVESQVSEAQSEILQASDNIEIARDKLQVLLGSETPVEIVESPLPAPEPEKIRSLQYHRDPGKRLDLDAFGKQSLAAASLDSAGSLFWFPKISLGADYLKYNNLTDPLSDWNRYRSAWNVGIYLNWTLFNLKDYAQSRQNHYRALQAEQSYAQAILQSPADFSFWKKRYLYSASLYQAKSADLRRAEETVRLAEVGFKAGVRTTTEVLDAELELFRAKAGIVNTLINSLEAGIKLELTLGESL